MPVSVEDIPVATVQELLSISSVYPNPVRSTAIVLFQSLGFEGVRLEVFDTSGRLVSDRELDPLAEGQNSVLWAGCGSGGETLADGVYIIRLVSGSGDIASARVVLLR
jgi:flagellar hook assembly protein FlgD